MLTKLGPVSNLCTSKSLTVGQLRMTRPLDSRSDVGSSVYLVLERLVLSCCMPLYALQTYHAAFEGWQSLVVHRLYYLGQTVVSSPVASDCQEFHHKGIHASTLDVQWLELIQRAPSELMGEQSCSFSFMVHLRLHMEEDNQAWRGGTELSSMCAILHKTQGYSLTWHPEQRRAIRGTQWAVCRPCKFQDIVLSCLFRRWWQLCWKQIWCTFAWTISTDCSISTNLRLPRFQQTVACRISGRHDGLSSLHLNREECTLSLHISALLVALLLTVNDCLLLCVCQWLAYSSLVMLAS